MRRCCLLTHVCLFLLEARNEAWNESNGFRGFHSSAEEEVERVLRLQERHYAVLKVRMPGPKLFSSVFAFDCEAVVLTPVVLTPWAAVLVRPSAVETG